MADDINKKISIGVEVSPDGQQQISQYKAAFDSLRVSISNLANPLNGLSNNISALDKDLSKLTGSIDKLNKQNQEGAPAFKKVKEGIEDLSFAYKTLESVISFVRTGVLSLGEALTGGLAVLAVFGPEILKFVTSLFKGKDAVDKAKLSVTELNGALESADYSNAVKQMNELKINVGLAKKGFLDKKEVLQQYNESLGKTMGKTTDINKVEAIMLKNGNAYIQMTLLKASAQLALQDAAKKAYEAEQIKLKSDDDSLTFLDKTMDLLNRVGSAGTGAMGAVGAGEQADKDKHAKANERRAEALADVNKQKDALIDIAKKFQTDAAKIAKNAGFNIFSDEVTPTGSAGVGGRLRQQRTEELLETEKLYEESRTRQLQATYNAYGNDTLAENNHYQEKINRLKKFLGDKKITQDEYNKVSKQLEIEHNDNIAAIIQKYNDQDKERTELVARELKELEIQAMKEGAEKQIKELQLQQTEKNLQLDKMEKESLERISKLNKQIAAAKDADPAADTTELQKQVDVEFNIEAINCKKRELLEQETQDKINDIRKESANDKTKKANQEKLDADKEAVDNAKGAKAKFNAEKQLITDRYQFEIDQAKGNDKKIKDLETKRDAEITALKKKSQEEVKNFVLKETQEISNTAFALVSNGIKHQSEAKVAALEKDKAGELSNSSLTSAQKLAIQEKYKKQEAAIKARAFREEQKASIAQAIINGAIAVTKAEAQTGVLGPLVIPGIIAETAVQIAKIASQKQPAYAKGGLHYQSDGQGGVLPGYSRTDNTNAYLRSGEGIVVSEAMQVPWARNLVSAINVGFGGRDFSMTNPGRGYAIGGIFTDGGDANRYYNQPVTDQKNLANTIAYQMINNFPPVYVDVKDVNNQQNILAQTINRVNL